MGDCALHRCAVRPGRIGLENTSFAYRLLAGVKIERNFDAAVSRTWKKLFEIVIYCIGGAKRDRTADLLNAIQALSQLSYGPTLREDG
jgi:hypothetical protein